MWRAYNSLEETINKRFEEKEKRDEKRYSKLMEHLVNIAGKFKSYGEEQAVLSGRSKDHEDRIGNIEEVVYKTS